MGAKTSKTLTIEDKNFEPRRSIPEYASFLHSGFAPERDYIPLVMLLSSAATAIVLARGGILVMENAMLIGTLSAFTSYAVGIFEPIQQLARNIADIISVQANIERVTGLLDQKLGITDTPEVVAKIWRLL